MKTGENNERMKRAAKTVSGKINRAIAYHLTGMRHLNNRENKSRYPFFPWYSPVKRTPEIMGPATVIKYRNKKGAVVG
jgi:hypothetical protein